MAVATDGRLTTLGIAVTMATIAVAVVTIAVALVCSLARYWERSWAPLLWVQYSRHQPWFTLNLRRRLRRGCITTQIAILPVTKHHIRTRAKRPAANSSAYPHAAVANPITKSKDSKMKTCISKVAVPALLTLALLATSAWAQTPAATSPEPSSNPQAATSHAQKREDFINKRINVLHAQLKITDQQSQQWDAFAQTMRDNAQKMDQVFRDRAHKFSSLNANDTMKSYAAIAQLHADNMQKLAAAFSDLYGTLSDDQKKIADSVYRNEHGKRHAGAHKHKPAAPAGAASAPGPASN
jgi:protein CpxP